MANLSSLQAVLQNYISSTPGIQGAAVVTPDGLPLASALPVGMDEERTSAMSAAMLALGERIGKELGRGTMERVFVQGEKGYGVLTRCGPDAVLLTIASDEVKQGLLFLEMKRAAASIAEAMK